MIVLIRTAINMLKAELRAVRALVSVGMSALGVVG
jgi:hypothetical protein